MNNFCIATIVSGLYEWYIPLFVDRITKEYPEYPVKIFNRNKEDLFYWLEYSLSGATTAALRFVEMEEQLMEYDYVLITDIDVMIMREEPTLLERRLHRMRKYGLNCYDNHISVINGDNSKMPGMHFVTKDWWDKTRKARREYAEILKNHIIQKDFDELMLYQIIKKSGLPIQDKKPMAGTEHGWHLGAYRNNPSRLTRQPLPGYVSNYVNKLRSDKEFIRLMEESSKHLKELRILVDYLKPN